MWTILPVCFHIPCNTGKFDAVELKTEVVEEGDEAGVVVDGCAVAARVGDQCPGCVSADTVFPHILNEWSCGCESSSAPFRTPMLVRPLQQNHLRRSLRLFLQFFSCFVLPQE